MPASIRIEYYGRLSALRGIDHEEFPAPTTQPISQVLAELSRQYPPIGAHLSRLAVAVDGRVVGPDTLISPGATLALLPPVSGG